MLSPFIPAASTPSAKPADQAASHKPEAGAPADGTSFHELLARKTNAPPAHSQASAHSQAQAHSRAQFHAKAQALNHHHARANERAEAHTQSQPEAKSRDTSPEGDSATAKAAREKHEKPVDHSVNRRVAKPAAKTNSNAADAKADTEATADQSDSPELLNPVVKSPADALSDTTSEDASATDEPVLAVLPAFGEQPQAIALPAIPLMPVAPLTVGLPTAGVPAPEQGTDSAEASAAVSELATAEGTSQASTAAAGTLTSHAAAKARASQTAAAKSTGDFTLNSADATAQKSTASATSGNLASATESAASADTNEGLPSALPAGSAAGSNVATEGSTAAAAQADARQGANAYGLAAQIADTAKAGNPSAQDLAIGKIKNSNQDAKYKEDKKSALGDGIRRAYELPSMSTTTPVFQAPTASVQTLGPVNANSPVAQTVASTAVRMVEKVSEVAEHLASNPAEQVTVRIDLDATHRVDVHVSMRGGQVHADFRSDSADMRAALASAWNEFSQKREGTDRQWAAPVFSTMGAPAAASSFTPAAQANEASLSFSQGQDSANRQAAEREAQTQGMAKAIRPAASVAAPASADVKTPIVRSENSQHLSVLA
ncbi:MAG: hypothetical protein H2169_03435 [Opitutus sp.]|nr:hypothetical protein [Opitutus sp.]